ncbi:MAG TPA: SapB/AmfS family lanthipeptide [Solirubrobacteraceae bacterium]|nr:SapB/AmfS family lanthipeptide [Solirubrobacteraceae bacterium]
MSVLDLQGLTIEAEGGHGGGGGNGGGGGGGSTLTVLGCASQTPSNLSVALCH